MIYLGCWTEGCPGYYINEIFRTREEAEAWAGTYTDRFIVAINTETLEMEG